MNILQTLILSFIEGVTEFLPISSTGHLILASHLLSIPQTDFTKSFEIIIQLGAILAVVVLYWKKLINNIGLWKPLLAAFIPTAVVGFLLYTLVKTFLLGNTTVTLLSLFIGGVILIIIEKYKLLQERESTIPIEKLSLKQALVIGFIQSISIIPGVSRAAATIIGGIFVGMDRKTAVEFSFLLAIPVMAAATGLDLFKSGFSFTQSEWVMLGVGFVGAFATALFAVKYFLKYVQNHTFVAFGVYRIILSVLFWMFVS